MAKTMEAIRPVELEEQSDIRGVVTLTSKQLRFQRRLTVLFTVAPLAGVAFAIWRAWGAGISGLDFTLLLSFYFATGIGISVGFHRLFTHRSFRTNRTIRVVLATLGSMSIEGSVNQWCATHRRHHAFADKYGDPHSPHLAQAAGAKGVLMGLWHAHIGWLLGKERSDPNEWTPDLVADKDVSAVDRAFGWLTLTSFLLPAVIGGLVTMSWSGFITAFIWGSLVRIFLLHHMTWSINSICHFYGKEAYRARDESKNFAPLAPISFGEAWHNNHHAFPWSARLGLRIWQLDFGWYVIRGLRALNLVRDVKVPNKQQLADRKLVRDDKPSKKRQDAEKRLVRS